MFINDVKRESFMQMMIKTAKKHGCFVEFEFKSLEPEYLKLTISRGNCADREYMVVWSEVSSLTDVAVDIWADFFASPIRTPESVFGEYVRRDIESTLEIKRVLNSVYGKRAFRYVPIDKHGVPEIKDVIFNDPATIVFWDDGSKTVVKCQEGDEFDPEKGLAMAISKKSLGNQGNYCKVFQKWCEDEESIYPNIPICHELLGSNAFNNFLNAMKKHSDPFKKE